MKLGLFLFALAMSIVPANAQMYEPSPLEIQNCNPTLGQLMVGENIGDIFTGDISLSASWTTSFLPPQGKSPPVPDTENLETDEADDIFQEYLQAYDNWTAMYGPSMASDGNTKTAWSEGAKGQGVGEVVLAKVDTSVPVYIWSGYGKSQKDFLANSRPRKVRIWALQAQGMDPGEVGESYKDVTALAYHDIELKDLNAWQDLPLPHHDLKDIEQKHSQEGSLEGKDISFVAVEILSVYPGTKYQDTLISEIANVKL